MNIGFRKETFFLLSREREAVLDCALFLFFNGYKMPYKFAEKKALQC